MDGVDVKVNVGRFGPYVQLNKTFVSIAEKNGDTIENMTIERAIVLIEEKLEADKNKLIKTFKEDEDMQLLNGRYGAYLKIGKNNFRLPKDIEVKDLTYAECIEISKNQAKTKGGAKGGSKAKATTKAKAKPKAKTAKKKK